MTARAIGPRIGRALGPLIFAITALAPSPAGMNAEAWLVAGLVIWMAAWWITEAVPLAATALLPFIVLPLAADGPAPAVEPCDPQSHRVGRGPSAIAARLYDFGSDPFDVDLQHVDRADYDADGSGGAGGWC